MWTTPVEHGILTALLRWVRFIHVSGLSCGIGPLAIARFFNRIKPFRRIATPYEKHASNDLAMLKPAAIQIWLHHYESIA